MLEKPGVAYYKELVTRAGLAIALGAMALACNQKSVAKPEDYEALGKAIEDGGGAAEAQTAEPAATPGRERGKLAPPLSRRFEALADALPSPCGKAHSLRKSATSDASCKRAPFAARYVARLLGDDLADGEIRALYEVRY